MPNHFRVRKVQNKSSKACFVLLEVTASGKLRVISPEGKVLVVPEGLFCSPLVVEPHELEESFSQAQMTALNNTSVSTKRTSSTVKRQRTTRKKQVKVGLGAEWSSAKLTFYKHKIDPLDDAQSFKITIESFGVFSITKLEFARIFNDVIISPSYWREGSYTYPEFPSKALKYILK